MQTCALGALSRAVSDIRATPCQGCGFYQSCATRDLACIAYEQFVLGKSRDTWQATLDIQREMHVLPNRHSYQRVFCGLHSPKPLNRPGRPSLA